jgi:hypothetical protein
VLYTACGEKGSHLPNTQGVAQEAAGCKIWVQAVCQLQPLALCVRCNLQTWCNSANDVQIDVSNCLEAWVVPPFLVFAGMSHAECWC